MSQSKIYDPVDIAGKTLRNRYIMGSMHTGLEDRLRDFDRLAAYFAERARGGAGLIVTGGFSPNLVGRLTPLGGKLSTGREARAHRKLTDAVHAEGGHIAIQVLHAGRYSYHPFALSASRKKAPIAPFRPTAASTRRVYKQIADFANCAARAQEAGYDGMEIMGSEGYFINQFMSRRTNDRDDEFGGSLENRMRLAVEVVRACRQAAGDNFIIMYRLSMLELVEDGCTLDEVIEVAKAIEAAGANIINSGIGWHEARIPTIATSVPRGAFVFATEAVKQHVNVPVVATNRINTPEVAEDIVQKGRADFVSMARPFLADPEFVNKAQEKNAAAINTCIGCNQACLDWIFSGKTCSCLVNPRACNETMLNILPVKTAQSVAVVGAGPAGLSAALYAARAGHDVTLFDAASEIGGQFNMAKKIAGKEEFHETLRYYDHELGVNGVTRKLCTEVSAEDLMDFDRVIVATGVTPRVPRLDGVDQPHVLSYLDVLANDAKVGEKVVIIGGGGIGLDTATYLLEEPNPSIDEYLNFWGINRKIDTAGGLGEAEVHAPKRDITIVQRSAGKIGKGLGKTTVWAHRAALKKLGVKAVSGVDYDAIKPEGLWITRDDKPELLAADTIILCAGQVKNDGLAEQLRNQGFAGAVDVIGGAKEASGLDANRAIREGLETVAGWKA